MLSQASPEFVFDFYWVCNIFLTGVSIFGFIFIYQNKKHIILKPSFILLIYMFIFFQLPLCFYSYECEKFLPNPYALLFLIHGFALIGLYLTYYLFSSQAQRVWTTLTEGPEIFSNRTIHFIFCLFYFLILLFSIYSIYVPISHSPLWLFFNGASVNELVIAREETLKTLSSPFPKYAYSLLRSCFVLLIISFGSYALRFAWKEKQYGVVVTFVLLMLVSILTGSVVITKSVLSLFLLSIFINYILLNIKNIFKIFTLSGFGIICALFLSILISGTIHSHNFDFLSSISPVINRTFSMPFVVGTWYVHFGQTEGFLGLLPYIKLAQLTGGESIVAPNYIGKIYCPIFYNHSVISTIHANSSFIFGNYLSWGILGTFLSLLMLLSLDLTLFLLVKLPKTYLIPFMSVFFVQLISFSAGDFGVSLVSHGYGASLLIAFIVILYNKNHLKIQMISNHAKLKNYSYE